MSEFTPLNALIAQVDSSGKISDSEYKRLRQAVRKSEIFQNRIRPGIRELAKACGLTEREMTKYIKYACDDTVKYLGYDGSIQARIDEEQGALNQEAEPVKVKRSHAQASAQAKTQEYSLSDVMGAIGKLVDRVNTLEDVIK
jgi:ribonucleotide reductase beta subunit family protein with ferritin-like domain